MTQHRRIRRIAWIVLIAAISALSLAAAEAPPAATSPVLQLPPAATPAVSSPAQQGIESIFLAQCPLPCFTCPAGSSCQRISSGCLVCVRCANPSLCLGGPQ
jgi:hypothetical protein